MEFLIEKGIPIREVNEFSKVEKGPGRPPHWELVFWWTRKPLAGARAIVAASLLPVNAYSNPEQFLNDLYPCRKQRKAVHACNPANRLVEKLKGKRVLDPFAGFGSIPLEAARLGAEATAVELLPTAYVFLKAVLEYSKLVKPQDIEKWGRWILEKLREEVKYDADAYIGTWEVKCPVCNRYTPLIGNWWLAKSKEKRYYERLAWMEWHDGKITVTDLNEECKKEGIGSCSELAAEVKTKGEEGSTVEWHGRKYIVPNKNIDTRRETAHCLYCKATIDHRVINDRIIKSSTKKEGEWYVRWALKQWNKNYERFLKGEITLEELKNSPARPTLLIKIRKKNGNVYFESTTPQDIDELWKAAEEVKKIWGDPDIPTEELNTDATRYLSITAWGFDKFYRLLNPRQLLVAVKLVKLIREVARRVEKEKLKEGDDAKKYAEAIATYLATALAKYLDYNSYPCRWDSTFIKVGNVLSLRGLSMTWNWVEQRPDGDFTGTFSQNVERAAEAFEYLSEVLSSAGPVRVLLGDAAELSALEGEKFDVVVTDPPYADDVHYAELSDFYYVWLKRALSDVDGGELKPRLLPEAFFDEYGIEISTQWQRFALREVSENEERWKYFGVKTSFSGLLTRAFANVLRFLREDGLLVVYYVAKKPEAWVAFVDALWRQNDMVMTAAYPVETEMEENVVARGKASVLGGYVSVWRRRSGERPLDLDAAWEEVVKEVSDRVRERRGLVVGKNNTTMWVYSFLAALEYLTAHYPVRRGAVELGPEEVVRAAIDLARIVS